MCYTNPVDHARIAVRELRNQVAAAVRRASAGERLIVTVDGVPRCLLGPLEPVGAPDLDDLVGAGLVDPPATLEHPPGEQPVLMFATDTRPDRLLRQVRGR